MSGLRDLLPSASGLGERGWDGFNFYRNVTAPRATASWDQETAVRGRVFLKVYGISDCAGLRVALNSGTPQALRVPQGTFPEVLVSGTFARGRNTVTISTACPANTLRVYKLQAHPLAPAATPVGEVLGASVVAGGLIALLAWGLRVWR